MTRNDIDRIYTETITNFIAQGYQIHTDSMGGTQGEIARVDLSNGLEIIRVFLETDSDWHGILGSYIILTVGRTHSHGSHTIWNCKLETLSEIGRAEVGADRFETRE
jgi:hypothetical protein